VLFTKYHQCVSQEPIKRNKKFAAANVVENTEHGLQANARENQKIRAVNIQLGCWGKVSRS